MLKTARNLLLAFALTTTSLSAAQVLNNKQISEIENLELFKGINIKVLNAYDEGSFYLLRVSIRGGVDEIYLTKDKKFLIAGDVINTQTGEKLEIPVDLTGVKGNESFTYGSGDQEFFLFTDPECPYCKKFESYFPQIKDKVKINVFFYPLDFHENAKDISLYIMSQKTPEAKANAMFNITKDSELFKNRNIPKVELEKLEAHLEKQMEIAGKLGVRGTPAVYDTKGNKVSWAQLLMNYGIELK